MHYLLLLFVLLLVIYSTVAIDTPIMNLDDNIKYLFRVVVSPNSQGENQNKSPFAYLFGQI